MVEVYYHVFQCYCFVKMGVLPLDDYYYVFVTIVMNFSKCAAEVCVFVNWLDCM